MKFITEEDLRDLYKKQPFTNYDLQPGERLTPGARQFLLDRGMDMYDDQMPAAKSMNKPQAADRRKKKLCSRRKSLQAQFLLTIQELLKEDVCLSQQLTELYKQFSGMETAADLCCSACTGINEENFSCSIGDCFEITEFHMQIEKGHEILLLHSLRSQLEEMENDLPELLEDPKSREQITGKINQIINTLSQMICGALGGKECQRSV